jgi:Tol biopolymer transport system component
VAWTPEGRVVYTDPIGDYRNVWVSDSDGGNRRRLTSGPGNQDQIAMARDGRNIVYKQGGNIWRMDADGAHPQRLTRGPLNVHPDVAADGRSVVYASFANWSPSVGGEPTLWRVPIDGGEATEIARHPASYPKVSPDGKRLGCIYFLARTRASRPLAWGYWDWMGVAGSRFWRHLRVTKRSSPGAPTARLSTIS